MMKSWLFPALLFSTLLHNAHPRVTQDQSVKPAMPQFVEDDQQAWKTFLSEAGRFSIMMPGKPEDKLQEFEGKSPAYMKKVQTSLAIYMVWYRDYPHPVTTPDRIRLTLIFARDYALAGGEGKIISESEIKLGEIIGREMTVEMEGGLLWKWRGYMVGRRFYQVSIWVSSEDYPRRKEYYDRLAGKYFDSFRVLREGEA